MEKRRRKEPVTNRGTHMPEPTLFEDLIKDLEPFDRQLVRALAVLQARQKTRTLFTSRFELCGYLKIPYSAANAERLDLALDRLQTLFVPRLQEASGFVLAKRPIRHWHQEKAGEKVIIRLGSLFAP